VNNRKTVIIASTLLLLCAAPRTSRACGGNPCGAPIDYVAPGTALVTTAALVGTLSAYAERIRPRACGILSSTAIGLLSIPAAWFTTTIACSTLTASHHSSGYIDLNLFNCPNNVDQLLLFTTPLVVPAVGFLARAYTASRLRQRNDARRAHIV